MTGPRTLPASVQARLRTLAVARGEPAAVLCTRSALEGLLARLSASPHRTRFVLKGALRFVLWSEAPQRPTVDLDLLRRGRASVPDDLEAGRTLDRGDDGCTTHRSAAAGTAAILGGDAAAHDSDRAEAGHIRGVARLACDRHGEQGAVRGALVPVMSIVKIRTS